MSGDNLNINNYTAADILDYLDGKMSAAEMHAFEKATLDDPFLADALEGFAASGTSVSRKKLGELYESLNDKLVIGKNGGKLVTMSPATKWKRAAAAAILITGLGIASYQLLFKQGPGKPDVAQEKQVLPNTPSPAVGADSLKNFTDSGPGKLKAGPSALNKDQAVIISNGIPEKQNLENSSLLSDSLRTPVNPEPSVVAAAPPSPNAAAGEKTDERLAREESFRNPPAAPAKAAADLANATEDRKAKLAKRPDNALNNNAQSRVFSGRVTDANNNGLPFVNITIPSYNVGTYTDAKGYFQLVGPDSLMNVDVNSLGYNSISSQLNSGQVSNKIVLVEDKDGMNDRMEVVGNQQNFRQRRVSGMPQGKLEEAEPVDGWNNYDLYLANNLKIPAGKKTRKIKGQVELSFDIDANGKPINITVSKSLCSECDAEAIRLLQRGPVWKGSNTRKGTITVTF